MGTWKMRPPLVDQTAGTFECWATALESWTKITPSVTDMDKEDIIDKFRDFGVVTESGGFRPRRGLAHLEREFGLKSEKLVGSGKLTSEYLQGKLKKSYVLVARLGGLVPLIGRVFHVVVVYGADKFSFCYMDPLANPMDSFGLTAGFVTKKFSEFTTTECTVMWRG